MGKFRLFLNKGNNYASIELDDMLLDDDKAIVESVRLLAYEVSRDANRKFYNSVKKKD